jgi:hypothetical protein
MIIDAAARFIANRERAIYARNSLKYQFVADALSKPSAPTYAWMAFYAENDNEEQR